MDIEHFPVQPVLLVDDEAQFLSTAAYILKGEGITHVKTCEDSRDVLPLLRRQESSAIVLDLTMPHISGTQLLPQIQAEFPGTPVIILTAVNEVDTAVKCMKEGALDYLVKPVDWERLTTAVLRALKFNELNLQNRRLKDSILTDQLGHPGAFGGVITRDRQMHAVFKYMEAIAETFLPVLITGETGVGKELLAKALHTLSKRTGSLVTVNTAGLDDTLFSDTLFGHIKGSFTGADADRKGMIEAAANGTLFLDELGDLSVPSQVKLLRLLQDGQYYPLGADTPRFTNARFVVATNVNLEEAVAKGAFRKDLYFRLRSHLVKVPPLRKRVEDIPLLLEHFLEDAGHKLKKKIPTYPPQLITLLATYAFPGNVRELQTMVFDAVARHQGGILALNSFKEIIGTHFPGSDTVSSPVEELEKLTEKLTGIFEGNFPKLKEVERQLVAEALRLADNNQGIAASLLGITRNALHKRLARGLLA
ncbi:MAG: sigma-54-dependent Fis family transcriptional regulator [bacterium]|nr:sigma-54-dependent Fis family transcriptional regulator [bacterium]